MTIALLIELVIVLVICGVASYLVSKAPFIDAPYKPAINWLILAFAVIYVLVLLVPVVRTLG